MRLKKVVESADAVAVIHAGDTVASAGYAGSGTPDQLFISIEQRFLETGSPRDLTLVFSTGQGDMKEKGLNRLAHEGLVRRVIGGYFGLSPKMEQLVVENQIEALQRQADVVLSLEPRPHRQPPHVFVGEIHLGVERNPEKESR